MGLKKHGRKKCLVLYDGYLTILYKAVQLAPGHVIYVCDVCGDEVLPSKIYEILNKGEKVGLTSPY